MIHDEIAAGADLVVTGVRLEYGRRRKERKAMLHEPARSFDPRRLGPTIARVGIELRGRRIRHRRAKSAPARATPARGRSTLAAPAASTTGGTAAPATTRAAAARATASRSRGGRRSASPAP